jgi:hypothetical protein
MKLFFTLFALVASSFSAMASTNHLVINDNVKATANDNDKQQILNGGFEDWGLDARNTPKEGETVSTKVSEPRYWHSFSSAYGFFKGFAGNHCFISTDAHSGDYSACIKATTTIFDGITANGTLTTGRLKAGSSDADSPENHSELDMKKTDTDRNGDPFYQVMTSRPDSIVFWVKYSTGKAGTTANMSAYITDGSYYQAPEDEEKTYDNKVGWAENPNIAPCTEWTRISVPFTYAETNKEPKAILLTFSTSATPGGGAGNEILYVDDVELIYNVKGDVNGDTNVDISDVVELVNIILGSKDSAENKRADVNGDTNTDISDVVELVNIILGN